MNIIWRFYVGEDQRWRWQRLSVSREVLAESPTAYSDYEGCLADARGQGYVFQPPQAGLIRSRPR